jgi:hypothetical protein
MTRCCSTRVPDGTAMRGTFAPVAAPDLLQLEAVVAYLGPVKVPGRNALVSEIKHRYERPLKEIFGC